MHDEIAVADAVVLDVPLKLGKVDEPAYGLDAVAGGEGVALPFYQFAGDVAVGAVVGGACEVERVALVGDHAERAHAKLAGRAVDGAVGHAFGERGVGQAVSVVVLAVCRLAPACTEAEQHKGCKQEVLLHE